MSAYSFLDVSLDIAGPNGNFLIGGPDNAGAAEEGVTITFVDDADTMVGGADGSWMHSLNATKRARFILRLLKTSPVNSLLESMYNLDRANGSLNWGKNTFTLRNAVSGDDYTGQGAAFTKFPDNTYAKSGNIIEWDFNVGQVDARLGALTVQP